MFNRCLFVHRGSVHPNPDGYIPHVLHFLDITQKFAPPPRNTPAGSMLPHQNYVPRHKYASPRKYAPPKEDKWSTSGWYISYCYAFLLLINNISTVKVHELSQL